MRRLPRLLYWGSPEAPTTRHPYRDTVIVYAALAVVIVLVAWASGGNVGEAGVIAGAFYVAATAWSLVGWRRRLRRRPPTEPETGGDR